MRKNGVVALLERSLDCLSLVGRPLSATYESVRALWAAREQRYRAAADITVDNNLSIENTLQRVEELFREAVCR